MGHPHHRSMPPRMRAARGVLAIVAAAWAWVAQAGEGVVLVVSSRGAAQQQEFVRTFTDALDRNCRTTKGCTLRRTELVILGEQGEAALPSEPPTLAVSVGPEAARLLAKRSPRPKVLHTLITETEHKDIARPGDSGIYLQQPIDRQLRLLRMALPGRDRVGILLGPESAALAPEIEGAAARLELRAVIRRVGAGDDTGAALQALLNESDVLLAVPDPALFNRDTLSNILLSSFRQRVPLVGYSTGYIRAGALAVLQSTPEDVGRDAAEVAATFLAAPQKGLPAARHPRYFSVTINQSVALSLGLRDIPSEERLNQQLALPDP